MSKLGWRLFKIDLETEDDELRNHTNEYVDLNQIIQIESIF